VAVPSRPFREGGGRGQSRWGWPETVSKARLPFPFLSDPHQPGAEQLDGGGDRCGLAGGLQIVAAAVRVVRNVAAGGGHGLTEDANEAYEDANEAYNASFCLEISDASFSKDSVCKRIKVVFERIALVFERIAEIHSASL